MKILVGIPCLYGYKHTMEAINSVINQDNVELLIIDNGSTDDLKELYKLYSDNPKVMVRVNEKNIYVNPAWNQIMWSFLNEYKDSDILVIMNSDLTLQKDWSNVLRNLYKFNEKASYLPVVVNDCMKIERIKDVDTHITNEMLTYVDSGTAGIFITLSRTQCEMVYDIPETMKVWFGDNWIYDMLRGLGHRTAIVNNLFAFHGLSQCVTRVEGVDALIELDRKEWYNNVEPYLKSLVRERKKLS